MRNPYAPTQYQSRKTHAHTDRETGEVTQRPDLVIRYNGPKSFRHNTECSFINIPCGHCPECVALKQQAYVQRVFTETHYNHVFFATLTYDNAHLPSTDVFVRKEGSPAVGSKDSELVSRFYEFDDHGETTIDCSELRPYLTPVCTDDYDLTKHFEVIRVPYADICDLQLMFKRMRDNDQTGRGFRYIAVTERGKKRARPHAHIMFFVPKQPGDDYNTCLDLEAKLKDMLLRYWARNVGTRKNPVYERNFTYRERWIGRKLYRNFDCHYVNPVATANGVNDVTFYVTKYLFKESKKEEELRKMLFKKLIHKDEDTGSLDLTEFKATWDLVKSRTVCSKGLGLDAVFVTLTKSRFVYKSEDEIREEIHNMEDLPSDDLVLGGPERFKTVWYKTRILVPNFDAMQKIKSQALLDKEKGRFVFVNYNGDHYTLCNYYQDRCLSEYDFVDLYYSTDERYFTDPYRADKLGPEERERKNKQYRKRCDLIDAHDTMDSRWNEVELGKSIDPYAPGSYRSSHFLNTLSTPKISIGL